MMQETQPVAAVVLLRSDDGAALLQHRDDRPGLTHAGLWTPPGGHCDPGEPTEACASREFLEETGYRCRQLRPLESVDRDLDGFDTACLAVFWDVYDGEQALTCYEGQALAFVKRDQADAHRVPGYLIEMWDRAVEAWRLEKRMKRGQE